MLNTRTGCSLNQLPRINHILKRLTSASILASLLSGLFGFLAGAGFGAAAGLGAAGFFLRCCIACMAVINPTRCKCLLAQVTSSIRRSRAFRASSSCLCLTARSRAAFCVNQPSQSTCCSRLVGDTWASYLGFGVDLPRSSILCGVGAGLRLLGEETSVSGALGLFGFGLLLLPPPAPPPAADRA